MGLDQLGWFTGGQAASVVISVPMSPVNRGFIGILGKAPAVNLNNVAAVTIFTLPGSGFTRCVVQEVVLDNFTGTPTTNAASFGSSGTPTDYFASVVLAATLGTGKGGSFYPATNVGFAVYGVGILFVINVTAGGAAITADATALGYFE